MIKKHNNTLNKSYDQDRRYESYSNYRNSISSIIENIVTENDRVLVIGAGNLNDLDLKILRDKEVTLLDIDEEAMKKGVKRQGELVEHFTFQICDLTGLESSDLFDDLEGTDPLKYFDLPINVGNEIYDVILVLPIYTQLLLPQLMQVLEYESINKFLPLIQNRINELNSTLRNKLSAAGKMIILSDVIEYHISQEEYDYLLAHQDHASILDEFYKGYVEAYGHGLGSYGILEMSEYMKVLKENYLVWPFSDERLMLVKLIATEKSLL